MSPKGKTPISAPGTSPSGEPQETPKTREYWIQLEHHLWDVCPNNIDRLLGVPLVEHPDYGEPPSVYPEAGRVLYRPLRAKGEPCSALIYRRYRPPKRGDQLDAWTVPDDRKVNPWDLNEPDPTTTMGTIPGPTIECTVGERVVVHFRNRDQPSRPGTTYTERAHSMHPHGFLFSNVYDGAYPLSPPDPTQPVGGNEKWLWEAVGVTNFKKGDRVPAGGTFTYVWETLGYPSTAGVWLYHDHSIGDIHNVELGAIGFIVIHNPDDPDDVVNPNKPGTHNGPLTKYVCQTPSPEAPGLLPHHLEDLIALADERSDPDHPELVLSFGAGTFVVKPDPEYKTMSSLCWRVYRKPPKAAQYLLLFHNLGDAKMCMNGRKYLGNTPTLLAGPETKMRFGVMGMGNVDGFHTFHIHGHRWTIPGPAGNTPTEIQKSPQVTATSQFEDTRTFGPANTFSFTITENSFLGALPPGLGEWHLHCHVLMHMMDGMMGSLLIVEEGALASPLPVGELIAEMTEEPPHPGHAEEPAPAAKATVNVLKDTFNPPLLTISVGETVTWIAQTPHAHTTKSDTGEWDSPSLAQGDSYDHTFTAAGHYHYHCFFHQEMTGKIEVT